MSTATTAPGWWPPGSTSKKVTALKEDDEVMVDLTYRIVASIEETGAGITVHFKDRDIPPRRYEKNARVNVWDRARFGGP
jgi:hypothetical protein